MSTRLATDRQKDLLVRRGVRFEEPLYFDLASELIRNNRPLCTDKQREVLESMGHHVPEGLTIGEAFEIIEFEFTERADDATLKQIEFIKQKDIKFHGTLTRKSATYLIRNYCANNPRSYSGGYEDEEYEDSAGYEDDGLTFGDLC